MRLDYATKVSRERWRALSWEWEHSENVSGAYALRQILSVDPLANAMCYGVYLPTDPT